MHPSASLGLSTNVLQDTRVPRTSSSPGWVHMPQDVTVSVGGHATFRCYTALYYDRITWTHNGNTVDASFDKLKQHHSGKIAVYGPVDSSDEGALIGCRVHSSYGLLPSHVAKITTKCEYSISTFNSRTQC